MEATGSFSLSPSMMAIAIIILLVALWAAYTWYYGGVTVTLPSYKSGFVGSQIEMPPMMKEALANHKEKISEPPSAKAEKAKEGFLGGRFRKEGFGGAAQGTGSPDCLRTSSEAAALVAIFNERNSSVEEGPDDLRELTQLVGKLACFKKDLLSPSYIVDATRSQKYATTHDIEPIAETTGRCFAKTVGPRDLTLSLDKWTSRGELLVKRLCTAYSLGASEVESAQGLFRALMRDISDIARGACLEGEPMIAGKPGPRDAHPHESDMYNVIGEYTGYY
jgi:hypothetical protein